MIIAFDIPSCIYIWIYWSPLPIVLLRRNAICWVAAHLVVMVTAGGSAAGAWLTQQSIVVSTTHPSDTRQYASPAFRSLTEHMSDFKYF